MQLLIGLVWRVLHDYLKPSSDQEEEKREVKVRRRKEDGGGDKM